MTSPVDMHRRNFLHKSLTCACQRKCASLVSLSVVAACVTSWLTFHFDPLFFLARRLAQISIQQAWVLVVIFLEHWAVAVTLLLPLLLRLLILYASRLYVDVKHTKTRTQQETGLLLHYSRHLFHGRGMLSICALLWRLQRALSQVAFWAACLIH